MKIRFEVMPLLSLKLSVIFAFVAIFVALFVGIENTKVGATISEDVLKAFVDLRPLGVAAVSVKNTTIVIFEANPQGAGGLIWSVKPLTELR